MNILKRRAMAISSDSLPLPVRLILLHICHSSVVVMISYILLNFFMILVILISHMSAPNLLKVIQIEILIQTIEVLHSVLLVHKQMPWPPHPKVMIQFVPPELPHVD